MAKPLGNGDAPKYSIILSESISFSSRPRAIVPKKPACNGSDDGLDGDDSQKTRRVNPQRLAARLGPEIVADMEALIYPGAKMPSFEVRRVIQERYGVDRRHIYDYFHSRGLRVAKEDRHTNLTRGRLSKALARQQLEKHSTTENNHLVRKVDHQCDEIQSQPIEQPDTSNAPRVATETQIAPVIFSAVKRKRILESPEQLSFRNAKRVAAEKITGLNIKRHRGYISGSGDNNDRPLLRKRQMVLVTSQPPSNESPVARTPSPCPVFALPVDTVDNLDEDLSLTGLCNASNIFLDIATDFSTEIMPSDDYQSAAPTIIDTHRPLSQAEREEMYNFINDSIGTPCGIMERAGTYCVYMQERAQHYFDRISFKAKHTEMAYHADKDLQLQSGSRATDDETEVDFRKWLSDYADLNLENGSRADSHRHPEEHLTPLEDQDTPNPGPQHDSTTNDPVIDDPVLFMLPDNRETSSIRTLTVYSTPSGPPLYDYNVDLTARRPRSVFDGTPNHANLQTLHFSAPHHGRHTIRTRPTPYGQKTTAKSTAIQLSSVSTTCLPPDLSRPPYLDDSNVDRLLLHVSRPTRIRTTSAAGGL